MKGNGKKDKAKKAKVIKKSKNRKNNKKKLKKEQDSDLSDFESELVEELPTDISLKVQKLLKEANEEFTKKDLNGSDFLAKDPLIDLNLSEDQSGFLPEFETKLNTEEIWNKLKKLSKTHETKEDKLNKLKPVYGEIGIYLSKYKSGGLPKAFKVLPKMTNWTELVQLTSPKNWTPNAMYEVTRLFSSNMNDSNVEIFYNLILLPTIRQNISENKSLNPHYYESLIKSIYKPNAFFKGILLPLIENGCTYKEASIIGSVLKKISIPLHFVEAFIVQICKHKKWFGSTSFILIILLHKKYKLSHPVVKECLNYFYKFIEFDDHLPVIWHQSLYIFLLNYQHMLNSDDYSLLNKLLTKHRHLQIGQVIQKLLTGQVPEVVM